MPNYSIMSSLILNIPLDVAAALVILHDYVSAADLSMTQSTISRIHCPSGVACLPAQPELVGSRTVLGMGVSSPVVARERLGVCLWAGATSWPV